ncbi:MAG: hypothetical protein ACYC1C_03645 [Chloroflexota bacterium]
MGSLLRLARHTGEKRYRRAAVLGARFLSGLVTPHGTRFGYYRDGRPIGCPEWTSPSGDVLRALLSLAQDLPEAGQAAGTLLGTLLGAQLPTGGFATAYGFAARGSTNYWRGAPEFRDVLPVVGWCDKVLRALAPLASAGAAPAGDDLGPADLDCTWRGRACIYHEDERRMELREKAGGRTLYRWRKGSGTPDVYAL